MPPPNAGIQRQDVLKILGVHVDKKLNFDFHVNETLKACNQTLFALRTMKNSGLPADILTNIFKSLILSKLLYASPSWWVFLTIHNKQKFESFIKKAIKYGYYSDLNVFDWQDRIESNLFKSISTNSHHALHDLLPPIKPQKYNLRPRGHNFILPPKDDRNFISRCLYKFQ